MPWFALKMVIWSNFQTVFFFFFEKGELRDKVSKETTVSDSYGLMHIRQKLIAIVHTNQSQGLHMTLTNSMEESLQFLASHSEIHLTTGRLDFRQVWNVLLNVIGTCFTPAELLWQTLQPGTLSHKRVLRLDFRTQKKQWMRFNRSVM